MNLTKSDLLEPLFAQHRSKDKKKRRQHLSGDFTQRSFEQESEHCFSPEWLSNLFDEDNMSCLSGDYSRSLTDLINLGHLKALERYLDTDSSTGLKTKQYENRKAEYGANEFRPIKLTSVTEALRQMLNDVHMQFLLIAAMLATILEMLQVGWSVGLWEGVAIFSIVLLIFVARYWFQMRLEARFATFTRHAD